MRSRSVRGWRRHGARAACVWIAAVAALLALAVASASATVLHEPEGEFKATGVGTATGPGYLLAVGAESSAAEGKGYMYAGTLNGSYQSAVYKYESNGEEAKEGGVQVQMKASETFHKSLGLLSFSGPAQYDVSGIAVDSASGNVYVADIANGVVDEFKPNGEFICEISGKVPAAGEEEADECNHAAGSETPNGGFVPTGIAVDASGHVFVADVEHKVIDEFGPEGKYEGQVANPTGEEPISDPTGLAVDGEGNLYVVNGGTVQKPEGTDVVRYTAATETFATVSEAKPWGVAVDLKTGHVYIDTNEGARTVEEQDAKGLLWSTFPLREGKASETYVLAVNSATGRIYTGSVGLSGHVEPFGPDVIVPEVKVLAPSAEGETTATLAGEVGPDVPHEGSRVEACQFEYVTQAHFEAEGFEGATVASCEQSPPYTAEETPVSAEVEGLAPATRYHVRLTAENEDMGTEEAAYGWATPTRSEGEITFHTSGRPVVLSQSVSERKRQKATLKAQINPAGHATEYFFEYGETEAYGHKLPASPEAMSETEFTPEEVSREITETLAIGGTYHYRVVATNSKGTTYGEDETFSTRPSAAIEYQVALPGPHTATIKARIDPKQGLATLGGEPTSCNLEYVTEAQYDASGFSGAEADHQKVACEPGSIANSSEGTNVIVRLTGLAVNTVYHYRFVAHNQAGTTMLEEQLATFGLVANTFSAQLLGEGEEPYTQAGGHPYAFTTYLEFKSTTYKAGNRVTGGRPRDIEVGLPTGMIGNPQAAPKCTVAAATVGINGDCAAGTQVGVIHVFLEGRKAGELKDYLRPLFNVVPPKGVAAEFASGEINAGADATIQASVRTGEGYGIEADSLNLPSLGMIKAVKVIMWGVPAAHAHDEYRVCPEGVGATVGGGVHKSGFRAGCEAGLPERPFLTAPAACTGSALSTTLHVDSYQAIGEYVSATSQMSPVEGCSKVRFTPKLTVTPEASRADSPTGLTVDLKVPQSEDPTGRAEANLKDATVTLPAGVTVNPAEAQGLTGCPLLTGKGAHPGVAGIDLEDAEAGKCPEASKIGKVELTTPLLGHVLHGGIYVARQSANPFGSLLAIYIAINDPKSGVAIKLAGHVQLNRTTGQLTTTFANNPQLPFEDLQLKFFGGPKAALATPRTCGTYTTTSLLEPWSHGEAGGGEGTPNVSLDPTFSIGSGPGGSACGSVDGFEPGFAAGTSNNVGGAYSPFVMNLTRKDGEQRLGTVDMTMPPGMEGMISNVAQCTNAEADANACPAASKIGHVVVQAGVGGQPITLPEAGKPQDPVYLTQGYGGAPFGLAIVVPAEAGPFNLGTVIVRARILVNPTTAQVSIATDASGPYAMPSMLKGIPVDVKAIHIAIDRQGFMFNPTSCAVKQVAGAIGSQEGALADVASRFEAAGCRGLPFHPKLSALTHAHHTRKNGDLLHVVVKSGPGQANIAKVHVELPEKLPSVLATLKHACPEAIFKANPANCPQGIVGSAVAHTPVLPVPLSGPVYFVSHGAAKFPEIIAVLQGDGVTVDLAGDTKVKGLVTTSTFNSVPDVPISRFDMVLPTGPKSAITGNGNLCKKPLIMPTVITGQNGAVIRKKTKVLVSGCKPALYVMKHHVKGDKVIVVVQTPSGGKITANGKGLARQTHRLRKAGRARISLPLKRFERRRLARGHALKVTVHLHFHPNGKGHGLKASVKVRIRGAHKGKAARRHGRHRR